MFRTRNTSLSSFFLGAGVLSLFALAFSVKVPHVAAAGPADQANGLVGTMLTGTIQAANGKTLEGVTVSARNPEKTFTTTVFTDEHGNYVFPVLEKGKYRLWVQAIGFGTERTELDVDPVKGSRVNFKLKTVDDFTKQLSASEWVDALPGDTFENRRLKEILQHNCGNCHTPGLALQNRFDRDGWLKILTAMETANPGTSGWSDKRRPYIQHFKEELATYLAKMRGPGPSPMQFHPLPRPTGEATRVVMTEYDVPSAKTPDRPVILDGSDWSDGTPSSFEAHGTHDVTEDLDGNAWFSSVAPNHVRTYAKLDTSTGKITNFKVDRKDGWVIGSHEIITGPDGMIWVNLNGAPIANGSPGMINQDAEGESTAARAPGIAGGLGRIDPRTGKMEIIEVPAGMSPVKGGAFVGVDGKGKIWSNTRIGALRFDPDTKRFTEFVSPGANRPRFSTYGLATDSEGNAWWADITEDKLGTSDIKTGKSREVQLAPRTDLMKLMTEEDRKFYEQAPPDTETVAVWAQTPRRMAGDHSGSTIWASDLYGQNIAGVDIHTSKVTYYDLPSPYSTAYALHVDAEHQVWVALRNSDRVGRLDPKTKKWTVYQLPSRGLECRGISVSEYKAGGNVWLASWRTNKVIRMQFRTAQQLAAVETKMAAIRETIAHEALTKPANEAVAAGEKLFIQRCSICHLSVPIAFQLFGPVLHQDLVAARGEDAVRKTIMEGGPKMPGWKYALSSADIDNVLAYLKTVTKLDATDRWKPRT